MTPQDLKEIAELIGGLSNEMQAGFARIDVRLHHMDARFDRMEGALLQTGSRWVNRMNQWAERIDRILAERDTRLGSVEKRVDKLEHGPN
jgi:hypothetical protein